MYFVKQWQFWFEVGVGLMLGCPIHLTMFLGSLFDWTLDLMPSLLT